MTLAKGYKLNNRYRIIDILGQGGMGSVYRALDESLGVEVAIKENLFTTDEYIRQFKREAVILASLRHSNLPRVTEHFIEDDVHYLVMDFVEGDDLRQRMDRIGKLPEEEAVKYGAAICEALTYMHTRNPSILHRDIKPGNVKLTPDGRVVLVDFGLAKVMQGSQDTTIGARAMTPGYSPPEQYGTSRTDPRSDIYALGATLYAALTGVIPEDGLLRLMDNLPLTPLEKYNSKISRRVAAVIEKAMAVRPEERFQTAEEFRQALTGEATPALKETQAPVFPPALELASSEKQTKPDQTSRPAAKKSSVGAFLLFIILILGLTAGTWFGWNNSSEFRTAVRNVIPVDVMQNYLPMLLPSSTPMTQPKATSIPPTETLAPTNTNTPAPTATKPKPTATATQRATTTQTSQVNVIAPSMTPATLEIFHFTADDSITALITSLAALDPNQTPILNPLPAEGGDPLDVLNARLASGQPPDTYQVYAGSNLKSYIDAGMIAPLGDFYLNTNYVNLILPPVMDAISINGKPYAVPYKIHPRNVLYYNKTRLDSVGFAPPKTFEELYTLCAKFKEKYPAVECISIASNEPAQTSALFDSILIDNGGLDYYAKLFTGKISAVSDPNFKASLQDLQKIRPYVIANHAAITTQDAVNLVVDGKALFYFGDETTMQSFSALSTNVDRVPFPANAILFSADAYVLPTGAPQISLSVHWLTILTFPEVQVAASEKSGLFINSEVDPNNVTDPFRRNLITLIDQKPDSLLLSRSDLLPTDFNTAYGQLLADFIVFPSIDLIPRAFDQLIKDFDITAQTEWYQWK